MAARPYARRPAALLTTAGAAGALLGWLARSRLTHRHPTRESSQPGSEPSRRPPPLAGPERHRGPSPLAGPEPAGEPSSLPGSEPARGPSPLPGPVPVPERTVDAPYTAEEPYTGRAAWSGAAAEPTERDVPGGTPP